MRPLIKIWHKIKEKFFSRNSADACPLCYHPKRPGSFKVMVFGREYDLFSSYCLECTEKFLNKYSTLCAVCGKPIFPGESVARAAVGAPYPFTHLSEKCCPSGGLYCGHWGKGKLEEFVLEGKIG